MSHKLRSSLALTLIIIFAPAAHAEYFMAYTSGDYIQSCERPVCQHKSFVRHHAHRKITKHYRPIKRQRHHYRRAAHMEIDAYRPEVVVYPNACIHPSNCDHSCHMRMPLNYVRVYEPAREYNYDPSLDMRTADDVDYSDYPSTKYMD